jgi:alkylation response protein AidB-like acyl-CoA dehydrogenase
MRFVLEHLAGIGELATVPDFAAAEPDLVFAVLEEAGRLAAEVIAPTNRVGDEQGVVRQDDGTVMVPDELVAAYRAYASGGWIAVSGPEDYGGHGFPGVVSTAIQEMLTSSNLSLSLCPMLTASAVEALLHHADDDQKRRYLPKLLSGEWAATMALTEPEAGSDVGALRAMAEPTGDGGWRLRGTKIFITWGDHEMTDNIVHLVLARTPDAPPGTRGLSLFVVPKYLVGPDGTMGERNDVQCLSLERKLGIHASPTCVMAYGEERGAVAELVGEINGGMHAMFTMMNDARLHVGLEGLGVAERAYQHALAYARERRQGRAAGAAPGASSPIIEHPDVQRMLLTMKADIEALRAVTYATASALDVAAHHPDPARRDAAAARGDLLTPVVKGWGTDLGVELTSIGIQVLGGVGYVEESGMAQLFRDARIAPIYEGTNGIQAIDLVQRKLPRNDGAAVRSFLEEVSALDPVLNEAGENLASIRSELGAGLIVLRDATDWLLRCDDPGDALAGASPYLRLFGVVAGGALLAKGAVAAHRAAAGTRDPWLDAKVATAHFYAEQILPQAIGLGPAVVRGAEALDPGVWW